MQDQSKNLSLIEEIRKRTRALHDQAELAMNIMSPSITSAEYTQKLCQLHALYSLLHIHMGHQVERQLRRLERDLNYFGMGFEQRATGNDVFLENLNDLNYREGVMYVIEGSALGGQVVSRHLRDKLGITPDQGGEFFFGDGPGTFARWKDRLCRLAVLDSEPELWPAILNGAEDTFRIFTETFSAGSPRYTNRQETADPSY